MFVMTATGNEFNSLGFGFGLTRAERKTEAKTARQIEKGKIPMPGPDPVPIFTPPRKNGQIPIPQPPVNDYVLHSQTLPDPVPILGPGANRARRRAERKQRKLGKQTPDPIPPLQMCKASPKCPTGWCDNGSECCEERMLNILPMKCKPYNGAGGGGPVPPGPGGKPYPDSAEGCIKETIGVGDCIHCCRANFQGRQKKQCVYGCNQYYSGGGAGGGGVVPGPTPTPTQSCGYECVGPGDTGDMQCEYVCHDYGGGITPAAPSSDVYVPPSGGFSPGGGTPYFETPEEPAAEEEQTMFQKYWPYGAAAIALVIVYNLGSKKARR